MPIQRVLPILLAAFPFSASAATVNVTEGQVLINRGQGFQQVEGSAEASPGEMIVTTPGGGAEIVYSDGCAVMIRLGSVYVIRSTSPCQAGAAGAGNATFIVRPPIASSSIDAALLLNPKDIPVGP